MSTSQGADSNSNPERSDNEPQHLIQPQHTYRCFSLSALVHMVYNCFTTPPIPNPDIISPSTRVSPGSYPLMASSLATVVPLEQPTSTTSQQPMSSSNRYINNSDTIHTVTFQRNTSQDATAQQEQLSSTATTSGVLPQDPYRPVMFGDHIRFHKPDQGTVAPPFAVPSMFQGARGFNISGNPQFVNVMNNLGGSHGLECMKKFVSFTALYNSSAQDPDRRCHPGTRKTVLNRLQYWIGNPSATEPIFWMHGPAGAGKTAIAQTISHSFGRDKVAATFFFYRSDAARNDGNRLFITLAWQLAFSIPAVKCHIANSLGDQPDIPMKDVETQFEELIVRPFQSLDEAVSPKLSPVVIIDGIDECTDERLQQRLLKVIGDAVKDCHVPLRFLISSRSEAHIQETVDRFECPVLHIDLAKLDDANHDIEKYLRDEVSRIASEQELNQTWPGEQIIHDLLEKSSGQFVYPSTVIRYVGDPHNSAITQLDIVLGLKPARGKLPFAELDALYSEILKRQPDQEFLMEFLNLLVARSLIFVDRLEEDDATLMNISDKELHRKLRGMRSLLKFDPFIDVYHRSFLDFLQDSLRSGQYYIDKQTATRQYLELITSSVIRYAYRVIEQSDYHETHHFHPRFFMVARDYPRTIELSVDNWQEALRPLVDFQDKLLNIRNFTSTWELLPCDECMVFHIIRSLLLHLAFLQRTSHSTPFSIQLAESLLYESAGEANTATPTEAERDAVEPDLDECLSSLLGHLRQMGLELSVNVTLINLMHTLLYFDHAEVVMRIRSAPDAQNLMDLIDFLNNNEYFLGHYGRDAARKTARLGLEIFAKIPVLPRSLFLKSDVRSCHEWSCKIRSDLEILCQSALMGRILDHDYIVPLLRMQDKPDENRFSGFVSVNVNETNETLSEWRRRTTPNAGRRIQVMLKIAKAIQYFHSMGVIYHFVTGSDDIFLDLEFRPKVHILGTTARYIRETPSSFRPFGLNNKIHFSNEHNISIFGFLSYEMYFDCDIGVMDRVLVRRDAVTTKPSQPEICEDAWQLIQWCCAEDPKSRPSIDEIVQEMEAWKVT